MKIKGKERTPLTKRDIVLRTGKKILEIINDKDYLTNNQKIFSTMDWLISITDLIEFYYGAGIITNYEEYIYSRYFQILRKKIRDLVEV